MLGIIGALDIEIDGIRKMMTDVEEQTISKIKFFKGNINNKPCVVAQCGVGKVNAGMCTQTMILTYNPDAIINTGVAGAVNSELKIGDIVVSSDVVNHDIRVINDDMENVDEIFPRGAIQFNDEMITKISANKKLADNIFTVCKDSLENTNVYYGTVASGEQFISSRVARLDIANTFNAYCCEMEGAAVGQVCYRNNKPFAIIRAISDTVSNNDLMDFEKFKCLASDKTIKVISALFSN